tara:strand:- start:260 stop:1327 length:1068 start_codon:yes stop_codon:yes gene_type:complete
MKAKILISTGGTGGHVIPATTIYDHLKNEYEIIISTDLRGLKYLEINSYKIFQVDTPKLNKSILLPFAILKVFYLTLRSLFLLKKEKIEILISTGGYMSLPLCLAAKILNIKIFLLEPNMIIGRANRFFLNFCEKIICYSNNIVGFPNKFQSKLVFSKPLIRKKYYEKNYSEKNNKIFTLMIIGGSQGAQIFDEIIHESIIKISKTNPIKIIHQTNQKNISFFKNLYSENKVENIVFNFDKDLDIFLNKSDLCITRAGASSLAEIAFLNTPFISIPLPTSKDNHQFENAKYYKDKDCCWVINQKNFDKQKFEGLIIDILVNKDDYLKKKKNLENLNYQNTWNNVNQKLLKIINEN